MATDDLERALRQCLSDQAVDPPAVADLADRAVRRARRSRRARNGAAAAVGLCLFATAGVASSHLLVVDGLEPPTLAEPLAVTGGDVAASTPAAPAAPLPFSEDLRSQPLAATQAPPVDLVVAGELHTVDGQRMDLAQIGGVAQASRLADGWLVVTETSADGAAGVWFVAPDTAPQVVLAGVDAVAVDPVGTRIAWRHGAELTVASVVHGELAGARRGRAPEQSRPVGFAGDAVLLEREGGGERRRGYGVWRPGQGEGTSWSETASVVYGALPDGQTVVAQVHDASGGPCLALLDVEQGLTAVKTACTVPLTGDGRGAVSADGRWLVANGVADARAASEPELALLVDLNQVFDDQIGAVREAGQRLAGSTVWVDQDSVVHAAGVNQLVQINVDRISTGQGGAVEHIAVPASTAVDAEPVLVAGAPDRR
ncbi:MULTISPECIES: hypothetical protein [unclassified Solwaraspora]|uniref:hypothetical protein n=1 Tax=unclassified Solwaraspora TaxID=2627926 RepID=UPI00248C825B|nr:MULTISPECIES: hypothetical protein [unclassified Solwaraspora]WBB97672.1 hypothetical protein O7553_01410 [Solwaraspora sp. WMMA2059]WBC18435.1 hypothetical protein O7543_15920 [Solwaraspora sp. WMMA2080]WJK34150.1 hypothetical protein O7610_26585 [Solwaraspora sp. WMMA2065]